MCNALSDGIVPIVTKTFKKVFHTAVRPEHYATRPANSARLTFPVAQAACRGDQALSVRVAHAATLP